MSIRARVSRAVRRFVSEHWPELLTSAGALAGWTLLTWAAADMVGGIAWKVSGGILLLSLTGWRLLGMIAASGLYTLSRDEEA